MVYNTILEAVGNTPLVRLQRLTDESCAQIYVKVESLNVGGAIKTRTALGMIQQAIKDGNIDENTTIVEPTSGNQGIGLAMVGAVLGIPVRIIMPDSVSEERRHLIKQYGADLILIHDEGDIGKCIEQCLETALDMASRDSNIFVPQQFSNRANVDAQTMTGQEIISQVDCKIDGFCAGIGTGGTISGVGKVLKASNPEIEIWAVEPEKAAILSGHPIGTHLQMGIGDGIIPDILDQEIYDDICIISDQEAIQCARDLARKEGILCGISSGTNVAAALRLAKKLGPKKTVVTILPDTGERYFSTELFGHEG